MNAILRFLNNRPWIYVLFGFALLISAWVTMILVVMKVSPQQVELEPPPAAAEMRASAKPRP